MGFCGYTSLLSKKQSHLNRIMRRALRWQAATGFMVVSISSASDLREAADSQHISCAGPRTRSSYGSIRAGKSYQQPEHQGLPSKTRISSRAISDSKKRRFVRSNSIDPHEFELPKNDGSAATKQRPAKKQKKNRKPNFKSAPSTSRQHNRASARLSSLASKETYTNIYQVIQHGASLTEDKIHTELRNFESEINTQGPLGPPMIYAIMQRNVQAAKALMRFDELDWSATGPNNIPYKRGWTALNKMVPEIILA
jgi:hypothetical protein